MIVRVRLGDCRVRMAELEEGTISAICCDPPYGLEFMGKSWDKLTAPSKTWETGGGFSKPGIGERKTQWPSFSATSRFGTTNPTCAVCGGRLRGKKKCHCPKPHDHWKPVGKRRKLPENTPDHITGGGMSEHLKAMQEWHKTWLVEAYRVLEPGGVIKAFGGSRVYHRLAAAMEDAGFVDVRVEAWNYGSGFPKSLNVSKSIDKAAGQQGEVVGYTRGVTVEDNKGYGGIARGAVGITQKGVDLPVRAPATEEAAQWQGWGTAMKPSWEPVLVGRKPSVG